MNRRNIGRWVETEHGDGQIRSIDLPDSDNARYVVALEGGETKCYHAHEIVFIAPPSIFD